PRRTRRTPERARPREEPRMERRAGAAKAAPPGARRARRREWTVASRLLVLECERVLPQLARGNHVPEPSQSWPFRRISIESKALREEIGAPARLETALGSGDGDVERDPAVGRDHHRASRRLVPLGIARAHRGAPRGHATDLAGPAARATA